MSMERMIYLREVYIWKVMCDKLEFLGVNEQMQAFPSGEGGLP